MVRYSRLLNDAPASAIKPVVDLSNTIFGADGEVTSHHGSSEEWKRRLSEENSIIVCASTATDSAKDTMIPVGFIFAHPRRSGSTEEADSLHIWLAGISPSSRGGGIFQGMMEVLESHARQRKVMRLSVCTFPAKFETMYRILLKTGWRQVEELDAGKVLLRKSLADV